MTEALKDIILWSAAITGILTLITTLVTLAIKAFKVLKKADNFFASQNQAITAQKHQLKKQTDCNKQTDRALKFIVKLVIRVLQALKGNKLNGDLADLESEAIEFAVET